MKLKLFIISLLVAPLLISCSVELGDEEGSSSNKEQYTYDFSYNGCETGKHKLSSKKKLCNRLQDHNKNDGCAEDMRRKHFKSQGCSGTFTVFFR